MTRRKEIIMLWNLKARSVGFFEALYGLDWGGGGLN